MDTPPPLPVVAKIRDVVQQMARVAAHALEGVAFLDIEITIAHPPAGLKETFRADDGDLLRLAYKLKNGSAADFDSKKPMILTAKQKKIRAALKHRALRTGDLADAVGMASSNLFRAGAMKELRESGVVGHHHAIGYYDTEFPPPDLCELGKSGISE